MNAKIKRRLSDEEFLNQPVDWARARPMYEVHPQLKAEHKGTTRVTIRLDNEVLNWFREQVNARGGGNYQRLINDALRRHVTHAEDGTLEETLRKVIREELSTPKRRAKAKA